MTAHSSQRRSKGIHPRFQRVRWSHKDQCHGAHWSQHPPRLPVSTRMAPGTFGSNMVSG
jgi:hypothetical protein